MSPYVILTLLGMKSISYLNVHISKVNNRNLFQNLFMKYNIKMSKKQLRYFSNQEVKPLKIWPNLQNW